MTHPTTEAVSTHVQKLARDLKTPKTREKLTLIAAALELMRRAQSSHPAASTALVNFLSRVPDVAWGQIPFSFTQVLLTRGRELAVAQAPAHTPEATIDQLLIDAAALFADVVAESPEAATQDVLEALIIELAEQPLAPLKTPHLFRDAMLGAVFQPHAFTEAAAKLLGAVPVLYTGTNGAQLRGVLFAVEGTAHSFLLETGEFFRALGHERASHRAMLADEWLTLPPSLLSYIVVFSDELLRDGAITSAAHHELQEICAGRPAGILGKFIANFRMLSASAASVKSLQHVFDTHFEAAKIGAVGATGPVGTTFRMPVTATDLQVVIDATADTRGPYATARLVRDDTVVMRLDRPRENSCLGVYPFPVIGADDRITECVFLKVL